MCIYKNAVTIMRIIQWRIIHSRGMVLVLTTPKREVALEENLGVQTVEEENLLTQSVYVKKDAKEKVLNLLDVNLLS